MATTFDGKTLVVDPFDTKGNKELMNKADEFTMPYFGENEDGESVMISVNKDNITVTTMQNNGWARENIYYADGLTEELFKR